jgi:hypothetical protein
MGATGAVLAAPLLAPETAGAAPADAATHAELLRAATVPSVAAVTAAVPPDGDGGASLQAVAEFAYAGVGPNGASYDRLRLLTAKLPHHLPITAGNAVGSTAITLASAPVGLNPGEPLLLSGNSGPEFLYAAAGYTAGANPVLLASPIQVGGANTLTYDTRSATGPRATDMTPFGMLPVGCVISEGPSGLYTMMLGAGADQGPPINTVMVSPSLVSGPNAQMDRQRSFSNVGDGLGVALASPPSSHPASVVAPANTAATINYPAVSGRSQRLTMLAASYSAAPTGGGLRIVDGTNTIFSLDIVAAGPTIVPLPPGGIAGSLGKAMTITLLPGGASSAGSLNVAALSA